MIGQNKATNKIGLVLVLLTFVSIFVFPSLKLISEFPKIEISDVNLLLLSLLTFTVNLREIKRAYLDNAWLIHVFLGIIVLAGVSIIANGRMNEVRDWFEPMKFTKLLLFMLFAYIYTDFSNFRKWVKIGFIGFVGLNFLHYYDIFGFNDSVQPWFTAEHHLRYFGLNSLGQPATKRMLGTLGNPNNNSIGFLLFLVLLLPKKKEFSADVLWSIVAISGVLACQSRTGFIALIIVLLYYIFTYQPSWKTTLTIVLYTVVCFYILIIFNNSYIESLGSSEQLDRAKEGRLWHWEQIVKAVQDSWILGKGVNKAYFEKNELYAENEYIMFLFRYGILGVSLLITFYLSILITGVRRFSNNVGKELIAIVIIFGVAGLTNTPLHSTKLSVAFLIIVGFLLARLNESKEL